MIENIDESIADFKKKFDKISSKEWIECNYKGTGGAGILFESLLGIQQNELEIPDFKGIEIKTKKEFSQNTIKLFCYTPHGKNLHEIENIVNSYGYPHKVKSESKILNTSLYFRKYIKIKSEYYFLIKYNYDKERIILEIYDKHLQLVNNSIYWEIDILLEKLRRKMKHLVVVHYRLKFTNNGKFIHYTDYQIYELLDEKNFLRAIEKRYIRIAFKINIFTAGKREAKIHDNGTSFEISEKYLNEIYKKIAEYKYTQHLVW